MLLFAILVDWWCSYGGRAIIYKGLLGVLLAFVLHHLVVSEIGELLNL